MPKYKVGDVAALFPKPKVATTEGGKKLQSLFSEFHSKGNKMSQGQTQQKKFQPENEDFKKVIDSEPQSLQATKGKKRKNMFSGVESNIKKVMKKIKLEVAEPKPAEVYKAPGNWKTNSLSDVNFPRRKKKFNQQFNSNFDSGVNEDSPTKQSNEFIFKSHGPQKVKKFNQRFNSNFDSSVTEDSSTKRSNEFNFKSRSPQKVKKFNQRFTSNFDSAVTEISPTKQSNEFNFKPNGPQKGKGFIKRAKHNVENGTIENFKIPDQGPQLPKYEVVDNNSLSISKNVKQRVRKPKKKKLKNAAVPEIPAASDFTRVPGVKKKDPNQLDFIRVPGIKKKDPNQLDFIRVPGIKKKDPNQPDFIKVPDTKTVDEKEVLSRTLFVGNLPTNTSRKALAKLFTAFGPVEFIRYNAIETDRNKIFKNGGAKLTQMNYAATSVPGFIVFKERENAANALALNGSVFENHHITVDFALPAGTRKEYDKNRSIFIGNLPFGVKDEEIWAAFAECGRVEAVRVIRDSKTGIGRGFGYVLFTTVRSRENALELKDVEFEGRPIRIKAVEINKKTQKRSDKAPVDINTKRDTFKSRAIKFKKTHKDDRSRKSVKKIMKKNKNLHQKKKIASLLQKAMK